jgi:small subunit ribosomal protein S1
VSGPVTNVTPFGAFVQIEEAVEGLIHASELDADPQTQPRDVLQPGQTVTARVISLDRQRQRMGLSLRRVNDNSPVTEAPSDEAAAPPAPAVDVAPEVEVPVAEAPAVEEPATAGA